MKHNEHYRSDRAPGEPGGVGNPIICKLFVHKPVGNPLSHPWRLVWAESEYATTYVAAEGECSAVYYKTMKSAVEDGKRRFGETATRIKS